MNLSAEAGLDVGFFYDDDSHVEPSGKAEKGAPGGGIFGRHVANGGFFDAWLNHGDWQRLTCVVSNQASGQSLARRFSGHPKVKGTQRQLEVVPLPNFRNRFFPASPVRVLHLPQPVDAEFAWARQHNSPHAFALSGVTHTISLKGVMERFRELVSGPFEDYDSLFCISKATLSVVRTVTDNYAAFLRERHGGAPRARLRLVQVPFGVDAEKFRPPSRQERSAARQQFGVAADEVCVLFAGRLSYFSKAHPFPMFRAAVEAARRVGCKVHFMLAGWADSPSILQKFQQAAQAFAPDHRTTILDGMRPEDHLRTWRAADVFTSLSDNIQESLGLTILEAQACGLPVVATDWDGCRDGVAAGETGFLVPTRMVSGATTDGTSRHLLGETSYSEFLGETNQAVAVDAIAASNALERLFADEALRARMGAAGRARVLDQFTWPTVIRQYQDVWRDQEMVRREHAARQERSTVRTPVPFPDVEYSFASYPTELLGTDAQVVAADDARSQLGMLLELPIANYLPKPRIVDAVILTAILEAAKKPCTLGSLEGVAGMDANSRQRRRATLAWLLKYDLLRVVPGEGGQA
ncbi:MAG: glycosyltransferase family 4 protein [Pseudomonadota bacterium]